MHDCHKALFEYTDFIRSTDIKRIEITDDQVVMTSREYGIKMICDPFDRRIAPIETLNFDYYEKTDSDMILRMTKGCKNIFDIGGNFGWYSLLWAKVCPDAQLFTFEPVPRTFGYLQKNIDLNGFNNIKLFNFGFSDSTQELSFFYYPEGSGNASIANLSEAEGVLSVTCKVKRLDDFVKESQSYIDFVKCDVEGAELLVFKGGIETIRRDKPIVFAELLRKFAAKFNYHPNEVIELFRSCGYRCFTAHESTLVGIDVIYDQTVDTNFFFLHEEKHADKIKLFCC
jgi:FkbM family methyltransferase